MLALKRCAAAVALGIPLACGLGQGPEPAPAAAARTLFAAGHEGEPSEERLRQQFTPAALEPSRAGLLDALDRLAAVGTPGDIVVVELSGPDEVAADVSVALAGDGVATYSVHLVHQAEAWRVQSFRGPDVEWPPPRGRRDEALSLQPALP